MVSNASRLSLLLLLLSAIACSSTAQKARPAPPLRPTKPQLSAEEKKARAQRRAHVNRIAALVAEVRGLPLRRPIKVGWIGARDVKVRAREAIKRELGEAYLAAYVAAFSRLGLFPPGYPYIEAMLEILGEQVAGYYDPDARELFVRHDMPADEIVLAHEIGHALQDQHFGLKKLQGDVKVNEDRNFAITALIEGDATQVMEAYLIKTLDMWRALKLLGSAFRMAAMDNAKLDAAPLFVQEGMMRPYLDGWALAKRLRSLGGQAAVDRAFSQPPVSSEQVLHPVKYLAREAPVKVKVPDLLSLLGNGWEALHENTLGEFGISIMLRQARLPAAVVGAASRGWGGDRFRMYRHRSGQGVLRWRTVWDSAPDAREFFDAYGKTHGSPAGNELRKEGRLYRWRLAGKAVEILDADLTDEQANKLLP